MSQQLGVDTRHSSQDSPEIEPELEDILGVVSRSMGVDLRCYRSDSITRRAENRLRMAGCCDYGEYLALLAREPVEARRFLEYVVIKWSRFFRDEQLFNLLRSTVIPDVLASTGGEITVWSAGCGRGEEAYSLAILLSEIPSPARLKKMIYGTDIDETALAAARARVYSQVSLEGVPSQFLSAYFTVEPGRSGPSFQLHDCCTTNVRFLRHDLLSGRCLFEPKSFHLVLCRNVLIYFRQQVRERVFNLLTASVAPGGYLVLGEAEQLPARYHFSFETVDRKLRIYRKKSVTVPEGMV